MLHRTAASYSHVFRFIEERVFKLEPNEFITDFEPGMRKAISESYPAAKLRGCWYHYSSALRKKILKLGLHQLFKSNENARKIKKMMMSLPLLPAEHFAEGYQHVQNQAREWKLFGKFKAFFKYYGKFWVNQVQTISPINLPKITCNEKY